MVEVLPAARAVTAACDNNHFDDLVDRVATGDRAAFRTLFAFMAMRVWRDASGMLPRAADARAVTRSTFVEVWHLARHHLVDSQTDTWNWIAAVAARHIDDRLRDADPPQPSSSEYDGHTHRELADLLGTGLAIIRIGRARFARVTDLNLEFQPPG
jgi:RNA polymerase sigma-70 factor (ECF subfamily)